MINSGSSHPAWAKSWHKTNFFQVFLCLFFLTFRLPLNSISSFFLYHKASNCYRNGSRDQIVFFIQPLKAGWLEAFSWMAFHTVEGVPLAPCLNTPAHVFAGNGFSNFFSLDSVICPYLSWRVGEATGNPPVESLPVLSRQEGCLYKHSILQWFLLN